MKQNPTCNNCKHSERCKKKEAILAQGRIQVCPKWRGDFRRFFSNEGK